MDIEHPPRKKAHLAFEALLNARRGGGRTWRRSKAGTWREKNLEGKELGNPAMVFCFVLITGQVSIMLLTTSTSLHDFNAQNSGSENEGWKNRGGGWKKQT